VTTRIEFHPLFEQDVLEHGAWLEAQAPGLGEEFAAAVDTALGHLIDMPLSYRECFGEYRRILIRRFHVLVLYRFRGDAIRVLGCVYGSRDLKSWLESRV
jgi:plasmid stabilization system protein ParE